MASILDLLNTYKGSEFISKAMDKTGESKDTITTTLGLVLPILLGAMKKNIQDEKGARDLNSALDDPKHGEEFLEDINHKNPSALTSEGGKILQHVLGSNQENINKTLATTLGIKESSISDIIKMAAPLLMSVLASQKKEEKIETSGLDNLIESVMGSSGKFDSSLISTFLDKNKDGSVIDDINGMIFGGNNKSKKGKGGILGGMLGGK
ncbi:MAG: DUF937 domain-containing protein [Bacteroidota bacterium]